MKRYREVKGPMIIGYMFKLGSKPKELPTEFAGTPVTSEI